jgi:hypothetical protein
VQRLRIYVSGPIAGKPEANRQEFDEAARLVRMAGGDPVVPHDIVPDHVGECPPDPIMGSDGHTWPCHLRYDLLEMLCCDGVVMLPGWERSHGSRLEHQVASVAALPVHYMGPFGSLITSTGKHLFEATGELALEVAK